MALYPVHCALQEVVARTALPSAFERVLPDGSRTLASLATAAFFAAFHLYVSAGFALITFVAAVLFGALYAKHRTLLGVTVAHTALGLLSVAVGLN